MSIPWDKACKPHIKYTRGTWIVAVNTPTGKPALMCKLNWQSYWRNWNRDALFDFLRKLNGEMK